MKPRVLHLENSKNNNFLKIQILFPFNFKYLKITKFQKHQFEYTSWEQKQI